MATYGGTDGGGGSSGGMSPWRNGHEGHFHHPPNPSHNGSGGGGRDNGQPGSGPSQQQGQRGDKTHETVCNMLSMLTLGVDDNSMTNDRPHSASTSSSLISSKKQNSYGPGSSSSADNQRMLLLNLANTPESCLSLRRAGCIPLLVELIHPPKGMEGLLQPPEIIQVRAARALKNIVQFNPDEKEKKKELRVLRLLEGIRLFSETVKGLLQQIKHRCEDPEAPKQTKEEKERVENLQHPISSLGQLTKLSFDEEHRYTMCLLGAIHALSDLIVSDHHIHGNDPASLKPDCTHLRRLTGMALTNLTVNDKTNKALLCGMKEFLMCLVNQLDCDNDEVCQISASVIRNLSHRVDSASRASLSEVSPCSKLMLAAIKAERESTIKANLAAIWNLSAQCPKNMADTSSASERALPFLISLMTPNSPIMKPMKTQTTIIEHASGILRNISPHLRSSPELKKILRQNNCYEVLLDHLRSSSMIVVGNACGTLCSLSGGPDCEEDQRKLLDLNAIPMLKSLVYSKDQRISQGSSTALRNLLSSKFAKEYSLHLDSRLSAQIYTSAGGQNTYSCQQQKSSSSESVHEHDNSNNSYNPHQQHQIPQQSEPPAAHQYSSYSTSIASSVFQHRPDHLNYNSNPGAYKSVLVNFHGHPQLTLPLNQFSGHRNRQPATNYYSSETEPLDLTMSSAKSSPIHVISAAEFAGINDRHYSNHHRQQRVISAPNNGMTHSHHQSYQQFYETNSSIQQHHSDIDSSRKFSYSGVKFNQSCPEILSRLHQNVNMSTAHHVAHESKPLDYSSTTGSTASSTRGGGGEELASESLMNDSNGGDTTFNYSLQFAEDDGDDERHHHSGVNAKSEDTVKTYCYEGTPQNFSKSNSCQDLVQELEYEREAAAQQCNNSNDSSLVKSSSINKLQPIDEVKPYCVENTPALFSRASSLSSIDSSDGPMNIENSSFAEPPPDELSEKHSPAEIDSPIQIPPQPIPRKRTSLPHTPCRVTFSAEETPLMFSRCSSVASLDSLDVGGGGGGSGPAHRNDDDLSDYSRRASEVVSPSELPDSPRALVPPLRMFESNPPRIQNMERINANDDDVKIYSISMEEKSGLNSCRSLSPLTVDGEELPIIGKYKLNSTEGNTSTDASNSTAIDNKILSLPENAIEIENEEIKSPDELRIFAVEGTPFRGVSNATSLSDLMADIEDTVDIAHVQQVNPATKVQNAALALVNSGRDSQASNNHLTTTNSSCADGILSSEEPIYSDTQLLEKCIQVGKAMGIPKSQSEFRINNKNDTRSTDKIEKNEMTTNSKSFQKLTSKSQDFEFDDPDLAALIQIGRNRTTDKPAKGKTSKKTEKSKVQHVKSPDTTTKPITPVAASLEQNKLPETDNLSTLSSSHPLLSKDNSSERKSLEENTSAEDSLPSSNVDGSNQDEHADVEYSMKPLDPNQVSTMSLGSEWDDETKTFSSIPSMSMSTAFKLAGSVGMESSMHLEKSNPPLKSDATEELLQEKRNNMNESINISCLSLPTDNELLENFEPPSTFSNLVSSTDCVQQSPQPHPRSQNSTMSDKLNKKWKALTDAANNSTHSNLTGQKPPMDFDMENSMISVASIKSEIYELSESLHNDEVFESAVEELVGDKIKPSGDNSIGENPTYTIFPPENTNRLSGVKSTDLSDGGITVISEDFTDAEDIEEYETAPMEDNSEEMALNSRPDKIDLEKQIGDETAELSLQNKNVTPAEVKCVGQSSSNSQSSKPLMQVHPLSNESSKYNTFVVKKQSMSPRSSPKQKRRENPERFRTHTINPINMGKGFAKDANGNPELKFGTFRVGGPKIVGTSSSNNLNDTSSNSTNSPGSSPSHSPKGIRGRRKPLYSSLPPSAIIRKQKTEPPPVPPKPKQGSSSTSGGVYVRPTRTTELRNAANSSRDSSPRRPETSFSRNSSNSSLNLIHSSSYCHSDSGILSSSSAPKPRPKVAPKPPLRTTPSIASNSSSTPIPSKPRGFSGSSSNVPIQIKVSNSSFGFGQQVKVGDVEGNSNLKGYSTLPKSSKFGVDTPFSIDRYSGKESKESIPGSEKSAKSGKGKISTLWKKMDFRNNHKEQPSPASDNGEKSQYLEKEKKSASSKLSHLFGRSKKDKEKAVSTAQPPKPAPKPNQPFREPLPIHSDSAGIDFVSSCAPSSATSGGFQRMRRDGENKVIVPPFNYTPPDRSIEPPKSDSVVSQTSLGRASKITTV